MSRSSPESALRVKPCGRRADLRDPCRLRPAHQRTRAPPDEDWRSYSCVSEASRPWQPSTSGGSGGVAQLLRAMTYDAVVAAARDGRQYLTFYGFRIEVRRVGGEILARDLIEVARHPI